MHARNRHLGNHSGFSVAFSNGFSVAFSNGFSVAFSKIVSQLSGIIQRIDTRPVDFHWKCPMDVHCIFHGISLL